MRLNIIDPNTLDLIGVLTQYESVQWNTAFNTPDGNFQINCSIEYNDLLKEERLIENTNSLEHVGVIKRIETVTSNQKESLQINGAMLEKDIFYKRVVKAWIVYQGMYPTDVLSNIIALSLTQPPEPSRKLNTIGEVIIPKHEDVPDMIEIEYSAKYPNLGDEVFNLIQNLNLGVKAKINHTTHKIDVEFYTGTDHTFGSDDPVVFSPERGTVQETDYVKDSSQNITELTVIGQDRVILKAERERLENEPLIEKSIDLSSELPWPTYSVEKPNDDGGQYYRYKKYNPPNDFITNRDVWEKYAVDRIETTETRYREVENTVETTTTIGEVLKNSELASAIKLNSKNGLVIGGAVSTAAALTTAIANAKPGGAAVKVGSKVVNASSAAVASYALENLTEDAVFIDDPNAVKAPSQPKVRMLRAAKVTTKASSATKKVAVKSNLSSKTSNKGLGSAIGTAAKGAIDILAKIDLSEKVTVTEKEVSLEPYQVTTITYETKDFLEYVYVNIGEEPTEATKIIQGSIASGDIMYYENFEEVKVEEVKYRDTLMKKAEEYLKTFVLSEAVTVKPYYLSNMVYGKQYLLGDITTARNSKMGFAVDLRVTQAAETWDSKGYNINITLGDSIPSLTNRIKLIAKGGA